MVSYVDKPEYVAFVLIFILFGMGIVAACLNLLILRLITLNTEDERRDEAAAVKVRKLPCHVVWSSIGNRFQSVQIAPVGPGRFFFFANQAYLFDP